MKFVSQYIGMVLGALVLCSSIVHESHASQRSLPVGHPSSWFQPATKCQQALRQKVSFSRLLSENSQDPSWGYKTFLARLLTNYSYGKENYPYGKEYLTGLMMSIIPQPVYLVSLCNLPCEKDFNYEKRCIIPKQIPIYVPSSENVIPSGMSSSSSLSPSIAAQDIIATSKSYIMAARRNFYVTISSDTIVIHETETKKTVYLERPAWLKDVHKPLFKIASDESFFVVAGGQQLMVCALKNKLWKPGACIGRLNSYKNIAGIISVYPLFMTEDSDGENDFRGSHIVDIEVVHEDGKNGYFGGHPTLSFVAHEPARLVPDSLGLAARSDLLNYIRCARSGMSASRRMAAKSAYHPLVSPKGRDKCQKDIDGFKSILTSTRLNQGVIDAIDREIAFDTGLKDPEEIVKRNCAIAKKVFNKLVD